MTENINEALKKFRESVNQRDPIYGENLPLREVQSLGDPNCPKCGGKGFLRKDLPVGHPEFGEVFPCSCRSAQLEEQSRKNIFSLSNLQSLNDLTFDTFIEAGKSNYPPDAKTSLALAKLAAEKFAHELQGWLLIYGPYGCGKTHLAAAVANSLQDASKKIHFITLPDLLDWMRFGYYNNDLTFEDRIAEIRAADILILDDFGTENATEWAREKIFQIINYRYINRLPTIITTNIDPNRFEDRVQSRISDASLVRMINIKAPDFRLNQPDFRDHHPLSTIGVLAQTARFKSFDLRKTEKDIDTGSKQKLEAALDNALRYAKNPNGWLLISGKPGTGKTHLAAAIANQWAQEYKRPLFTNVPDLLDHLRATFSPQSPITYDNQFEEIKSAEYLVLDDITVFSATAWAVEKLNQLLNYRYLHNLPTVITLEDTEKIKDTSPRLYTKLADTRISKNIDLGVPAYGNAQMKKPTFKKTSTEGPQGY